MNCLSVRQFVLLVNDCIPHSESTYQSCPITYCALQFYRYHPFVLFCPSLYALQQSTPAAPTAASRHWPATEK